MEDNVNLRRHHSIIYLSILTLLFSCSSTKLVPKIKSKPIIELHFVQQNTLTVEGKIRFDSMQQVMLDEIVSEKPEAEANASSFPPGFMAMMFTETNPEEKIIHLGDTLWTTLHSGNTVHYRYDTIEQKCYVYYDRNDAPVNISDYSKFDTTRLAGYREFPDEQLTINGFICYKVLFSLKEEKDSIFKLGEDMFEMYVTNEINLPMNMVIPYQLPNKNYFPLRVERWSACCKGADETTVLEKIVYQE